ncbi:MAG: IS1 family transposase [Campylobacterota bacterium]|nr:IS1 family transposase [Campylobacterota bacterium]
MKCYEKVKCPRCGSDEIEKSGFNENRVQRYRCKHEECEKKTFVLSYRYKACELGVREQIIEMAINGSGTSGD